MEADDHYSGDSSWSEDGGSNKSSVLTSLTTLAIMESLTVPLVQEVVISADVKCLDCQKRISDVISRLNVETESVVVNLSEKKVVITCNYIRASNTQITPSPWKIKVASIKRIFCSSKH